MLFRFFVNGKRVFSKRFRIISIFIMVIGILQILLVANIKEDTKHIVLKELPQKKHNLKSKKVKIEDNVVFNIDLFIYYSIQEKELIPISCYSKLTGYSSGFNWKLINIETNNRVYLKKEEYTALGILKWNLFGINIYSQMKTFNVTIE